MNLKIYALTLKGFHCLYLQQIYLAYSLFINND
jgi:hypothetical protein